ncbi:D-3-phosphoglycerate dehydrogenase [Nocardioides sp. CF8]|uniref:phosphonate dehydrogenase n=1 Tax=Nocardioides sp. CF8 TaxID=110319 RepID=UPI00032F6355|nr:phosphonate dehydrogenase [Nocardioides sp. CF8]EON24956.1 D-3-phosphoglycerate dehydrogenase [Nocardioides sp. CF8]
MTTENSRPVVVLTHRVHDELLDLLGRECDVVSNQTEESLSAKELRRRAADADALMAFMPDRIDAAFLDGCPRLRIVAGALKGYDNIDVGACTARGVWLTRVEDALTEPTAELALGLLVGLARNIGPGDRRLRDGLSGWRPALYGRTLIGSTIGIVGAGAVGRAVARLLVGFSARVVYSDPNPVPAADAELLGLEQVPLEELLRTSDAVVVCAPLLPETTHLLDRVALASMPAGAMLVNVGRGSVVHEEAVAEQLRSGRLGGYAADVFEFEDLSRAHRPDGPHPELVDCTDRTLLTPHLGSAVADSRLAIEERAARSILQALAGCVPDGSVNDPHGLTVSGGSPAI